MAFELDDIRQSWREATAKQSRKNAAECSHANERKGDGLNQEQAIRKYGLLIRRKLS